MTQRAARRVALMIASTCFVPSCIAAEIELRFGALERIIAAQLFTQDGRHYVRGSRTTHCQFAYLEAPHIDSDHGQLRVRARFSGRSALDVMNRCIGLGDSFDLTVTATPVPHNGAIILRDVKVTTPRDSYYIRKVRTALAQSISKDFKIEVHDQARRLLEPPGEAPSPSGSGSVTDSTLKDAPYKQELAAFDLGEIHVTPDALVLVVEFRLVVK
jgi:hypothetical protein